MKMTGLKAAKICYVPTDKHHRMDVHALRELVKTDLKNGLKPFMVVGTAGTVNSGAIDPLDAIADVAQEFDLWFHVDAAYGGCFLLVDDLKCKFKGIERSDSTVIDPHKGFFLQFGIGTFLVKNVEAAYRSQSLQSTVNYFQDSIKSYEDISPSDISPELTKHFRGLRMWMSLHLLGLNSFKAALEEKVWLCRYFYTKVQNLGFEVGPYPDLSIMIYRYLPESGDATVLNEKIMEYVRNDGRVFLTSTTINGVYWIRLSVLSFRTHLKEIELCLDIMQSAISSLTKQKSCL